MRVNLRFFVVLFATVLLTQCETLDTVADAGTIIVEGTQFYPDETGLTYIVPEGEVIATILLKGVVLSSLIRGVVIPTRLKLVGTFAGLLILLKTAPLPSRRAL